MNISNPDFSNATILFGGSFDPLHLGHIELAKGADSLLSTPKQVVFVPCFLSPGKADAQASPEERLHLLQLGLKNTPFQIWDFELNRPSPSFTIDTLREAHRRGASKGRLYLLLGADSYGSLAQWKEAAKLRDYARLIIGNRPGHSIEQANPEDWILQIEPKPIASHEIRKELAQNRLPERSLPIALEEEMKSLFLNSRNPYVK